MLRNAEKGAQDALANRMGVRWLVGIAPFGNEFIVLNDNERERP